jgi:hypothetical protein
MNMLLLVFQLLVLQQETVFSKKQYDGYTLHYAYETQKDAVYFIGYIVEDKSGAPVNNVNIYEEKSLEGTVPNPHDEKHLFKLRLTKKKGKIVFDKPRVFRFYYPYLID